MQQGCCFFFLKKFFLPKFFWTLLGYILTICKNLWSKYGNFNFIFHTNMATVGHFFQKKILCWGVLTYILDFSVFTMFLMCSSSSHMVPQVVLNSTTLFLISFAQNFALVARPKGRKLHIAIPFVAFHTNYIFRKLKIFGKIIISNRKKNWRKNKESFRIFLNIY